MPLTFDFHFDVTARHFSLLINEANALKICPQVRVYELYRDSESLYIYSVKKERSQPRKKDAIATNVGKQKKFHFSITLWLTLSCAC